MESLPIIGVGVTTYKREAHIKLFVSQMKKFLPPNCLFKIISDREGKGVAWAKNEALRKLKNCDYIFLFDDDCFPIKGGWAEFFIKKHKETGQDHFLYLKETSTIRKVNEVNGLYYFNNCGGCFMFLTKEVIEKVGGFNPEYSRYGYEHAGYSKRVYEAGLTTYPYICPKGAEEFITSFDYDFTHLKYGIDHQPSMIGELDVMIESLKHNEKIYKNDKGFIEI